ncbi:MAG: DUF349 domain-containing protein [Candidatus Neomarinimicrobiota bacterium]|nr:MAG: DUF349 domain-containing protein [Candidatus Neomarinimicrobiota bacterium]
MVEKEQSNQNPEIISEEKPETVKKKTVKVKKQIKKKEKDEILNLLVGNQAKEEAPKVEQINSISETEKKEIVSLLADPTVKVEKGKETKKAQTAPPPPEEDEVEEAGKNQISEKEKNEIIVLLGGKIKEGSIIHEDIDYEHLNKQELVELLEDVVDEKDILKIKKQVSEIKFHFHKLNKDEIENQLQEFVSAGGNKDEFKHAEDPLEKRFNDAFGIYRHNKHKFSEELEKQKVLNLELKHKTLEELKELINSEETLKRTYDEFKVIQEKWKEIGMVPASALSELWRNYHFLVEKFFDKVRINNELRDLDMKKNMEAKIRLCEKAEELLMEDSVVKSFKLLQKYHDEYREIGPAPNDKREELWERFKAATEKINQIRREYYTGVQEVQEKNYTAKLELIEQVKEFVASEFNSIKEWNNGTDRVNDLFKTWKTLGRVPKAHNDEVWETFRGHINTFFERKREYFAEVKDQQMNNYNQKLGLCVEAEGIKDSSEWGKTTKDLINLQKQWKEIGPVPRRHSDKIWKRFRLACDDFFNRKSEFFKGRKDEEKENLVKKNDLIEKIVGFEVVTDRKKNIDALKELQRSWVEIGHVPFDKKDKLHTKYRAAIDGLVDKMDIKKSDLSAEDFKDRIEIMRNSPDAERAISKESNFLRGKIRKLQEDVTLWENNIGFFSISNKSSTLKDDFQKKIDRAKNEIEQIKEKIKLMRDV